MQKKLKNFFFPPCLFLEDLEKPDFLGSQRKMMMMILIFSIDDSSVHEITDKSKVSFKRENLTLQYVVHEQVHISTNLTNQT